MISFRFHIVSIAAVFLAIAIGVVVGSTYVDRAIVDGLEDRIETVSTNLDERREEIAALERDLARSQEEVEAGLSFAVSGRLPDTPTLVVAARGVDAEPVRRLVLLARQAGAVVPGIVWIEPRLALEDDGAADELAELVDIRSSQAETVRARAWDAALADLQEPEIEEPSPDDTTASTEAPVPGSTEPTLPPTTDTPTTLAPPEAIPPTLAALLEGGYLTFEPIGDNSTLLSLVGRSPAVIVVTGTDAEDPVAPLVAQLADGAVDSGAATVVAEVYVEPGEDATDPPSRGAAATSAAAGLATDEVAVVDHLDQSIGAVAAVLALSDLGQGIGGHYGFGDGASGILPAWTGL